MGSVRQNWGNKIRPQNNLLDLITLIYLKVTCQYSSAHGLVELVNSSTSRKAQKVPWEKSENTDAGSAFLPYIIYLVTGRYKRRC